MRNAGAAAPPDPRGARADHRGDQETLGGGEEGQSGGEISHTEESDAGGGQTGPEARCPEKRRQEFKVGGRAGESGWPGEGGARKRPAAGRAEGGKSAVPAEAAAVRGPTAAVE